MKTIRHMIQSEIWRLLYPVLLVGTLHVCYHRYGAANEQLGLVVFGISIVYFLLIYLCEYYDGKQSKLVGSYERSILIAICISISLGFDIYSNDCDWMDGLILFLFLCCIAILFWEPIERFKGCLEEKKIQKGSMKKKDWLYRDKFLNRMHRRIREIAETRKEGITIGIVGSWGVGKTYMIEMLCDLLSKEIKDEGYNQAFKVCDTVELWQAVSLDDAWNRVIYALHTRIIGKPPIAQSKFWRMICNIASANKVAKQICEIVEPEFEELNLDAIEKQLEESRVVLVFDDLERTKFEIVQAMLPLLERLKKFPHLIVICALAEDELCELMRRNKVNPEYTYGHLNKLFDLKFEIPELGNDAVDNYLRYLYETKRNGCRLTESFFRRYHIQFDNPRQMDRVIDKLTCIESQYFSNLGDEINFENCSMTFDLPSKQVLYIYVVEALRIIAPHAIQELAGDYGTKTGKIPSRFLNDSISFIITFCMDQQPPTEQEEKWIEQHPNVYKELSKSRAFLSFMNIVCDPENQIPSEEERSLFINALNGVYKRNTSLSEVEAAIIVERNMKESLSLSQQIQNFYEKLNENYEPSFFDGNVRALLQYILSESHEKEDEYLKYVENSLEKQSEVFPRVGSIFSSHEFSKFIGRCIKLDELDESPYSCDIKKFEKRETIFKLVYGLMSLREQTNVLLYSCQKMDEMRRELALQRTNTGSNEIAITYKNFTEEICLIYGESLYQAIKDKNIMSVTEVEQYKDYLTNREISRDYVEKIGHGLASKLCNKTENRSFYISWLWFLRLQYMEKLSISEKFSSCITRKIALVARFIRDKIRETDDEFYSSLSPEESNEALNQCNESINALEQDISEWMGYQDGSEIEATEYSQGIEELLLILRTEKTNIEKL